MDQTFRTLLVAGLLILVPIGLYHRLKAHATHERLDRRQEGFFILLTLRPLGLMAMAGLIAYLINPAWMSWSSVALPHGTRRDCVVLGLVALFLLNWTFRTLGRNLTDTVVTRKEHSLVTAGPYRWVRHPFYSSAALAILAGSLVAANAFLFVTGGLAFTLLLIRTQKEEAHLLERFGEEYAKYAGRTGRFLPRVWAGNRHRRLAYADRLIGRPIAWVRRHPIAFFLVATGAVTYVLGIAAFLALGRIQTRLGIELPWVNEIVLKFGPTLGGVLTIALVAGRQGLRDLFRRCIRWRLPAPLYLGAVLVQPVILLLVLFLRGFGSEVRSVRPEAWIDILASQLLLNVLLGGGFGEELGWRGFMLPRLCERYSPLVASGLVGIAWFGWHVPGYVLWNKGASDPVFPFAVVIIPFSIVLTWAYFRSKESLLLVALLHGSINASFYAMEELLPGVTGAAGFQPAFDWTVAGCWCVLAGIVVLKWRFGLGREQPPKRRAVIL